ITTERAIGDRWLVSAGLKSGDRMIVEGLQKVRPGVPVKAVPFKTAGNDDKATADTGGQKPASPSPKAK
ncbi:MAG TPA: hypothetical protein PKJ17_07495, partial [Syntrophorhabdaceae bacterium]|nr:hypothetical protein [Syntrophorhabdaceae bacterium]